MPVEPSDHNLNNSGFKSYPLAQRSSRFSAFVIDSILLSILGASLTASGFYSAQGFLIIFYFTLLHTLYGQTLGKKLLGLKIVSADHSHPKVKQVLLRETIGRLLNALLFGAGYVRALFAKDRKGFHDLISGTTVVQIKAIRQGQTMSFGKMLFLSFSGLTLSVAFTVYILLFTSYTLKEWAKKFDLQGVEITGIKGSPARGFSIQRLSFKNETGEVDLRDIRFKYTVSHLFLSEEILIQNVSIGSGVITAKKVPTKISEKSNESTEQTDEQKNSLLSKKGPKKVFPGVTIENVDVANLKFVSPLSDPFTLERFLVINFKLNDSGLSAERLWIESDALDVDLNGLLLDKKTFASNGPFRGKIKAKLLPKYLKHDFDFQGKFEFGLKANSIENLHLAAFERRLQIKKSEAGYSFTTFGLSIRKFIVNAPPVDHVSLHIDGPWPQIALAPIKGSFQIHKYKFQNSEGSEFKFNRDGKTFSVLMTPLNFLGLYTGGQIVATSEHHSTLNEWLSDLYFEKSHLELTPSEAEFLSSEIRHFTFKPSVSAAPPLVIATQPIPIQTIKKMAPSDLVSKKIIALRRDCRKGSERTCSLLLKELQASCSRKETPSCAEVKSILRGRPLRLPAKSN